MISYTTFIFFALVLLVHVSMVTSDCTCDRAQVTKDANKSVLDYKLGAIAAILVASALGVTLPILSKNYPPLHPSSNLFFLVKSFAAGVILSTGFIHVLPDAFENLTSPCLKENPWGNYPFTGLAGMVGALGSLMIDAIATTYYRRVHFGKADVTNAVDEETSGANAGHVHLHNHSTPEGPTELERIRFKVISQVLEMGIVVHSVIIGLSVGTSDSLATIKPLMIALCFHQFFEGVGLGGCIVQASFKSVSTITMGIFFSLTTPLGIAIGIGIANGYDDNSPTSLIVQGLLDAIAAGILIYMALVDLLAQDFMNPKMQSNGRLFFGANVTLLLGAGFMAVLAIWA